MPAVDYSQWCCADPVVGGCPHHFTDDHDRDTGHCLVIGCVCTWPRNHTPTCVHAEVADDPA